MVRQNLLLKSADVCPSASCGRFEAIKILTRLSEFKKNSANERRAIWILKAVCAGIQMNLSGWRRRQRLSWSLAGRFLRV